MMVSDYYRVAINKKSGRLYTSATSSLAGFDLVGFDLGFCSAFYSKCFKHFERFGEGDVTEVGSLSAASDIGSSSLRRFCRLAEVEGEPGA